MSFTSIIKEEIFTKGEARHCRIAEMAAIINGGARADSPAWRKLAIFGHAEFGADSGEAEWRQACGIGDGRKINGLVVKSECCKKAYLRGCFLAGGVVLDPRKSYHMEFAAGTIQYAQELMGIMHFFQLNPRIITKSDSQHVIYFKKSEEIGKILAIIEAHVSMMDFELASVDKEVNNALNRANNWIAANENKQIAASAKHFRDILHIQERAGLAALPPGLQEIAIIRLENPLDSLADIGAKLSPHIGKSGVNHRLRKISQIANEI